MKKLFTLLLITISLNTINAQQWSGDNNTTSSISRNGNVGIGIITPTEKLQVNGTAKSTKFFAENNSNNSTLLDLQGYGNNRLFFYNGNESGGYTSFVIRDNNDNTRFQHSGSVDGSSIFHLNGISGGNTFGFALDDSTYGNFLQMPNENTRVTLGGWISHKYNLGHKFVIKNGSALIEGNIITDSKIGVGVASKDIPSNYKLAVAGGIIAEEVNVELQNTWPDYVFEKEYNLPSLKDVENYIAQNGHLKNIPSAEKIGENGINIGEMNAKLLEKIEELTLYIIKQEKRIEKLETNQKQLQTTKSKR